MHAVLAAVNNPRRRIERLVATRNGAAKLPSGAYDLRILEPDAMDGMLPPGAVHQGLAARCYPLEPLSLEAACAPADHRPVLIMDGVTDPQNVGAAFRAAAAFSARAVVLQDRKAPPLGGVVAKAAAGAVDLIPHVRVTNLSRALEDLRAAGYLTLCLAGDAEEGVAATMDGRPVAVVVGSEGKGVRPSVAAACERAARIPIDPTMESLNVATAAAIALYEARRAETP